jgi:diguanylate cyclase (GGDEF)-like protein
MNIFIPKDDEYKELSSLKLAQQRHGIYKAKSADKKDVYVFLDPIDQTDWTIGVSVPEEEIFKLYKKLKGIQLTIIFVLIIEILVFIILGVIYITIISGSYDPITNLYNQEKFEKKARKMLKQFEGSRFILIDADLRGFKFINQTYGEEAANQILIKFANLLKGETLKFDGLCAKGYADHFYVFAKIENASIAMEKASKSIEKIAKELKSKDIHVVAKYGITFLNSDRKIQSRTKTIRTLIGEASFAKSLIKENVTKAFEIYSPKIEEKINYEHKIERQMEDAVKNDEFFVMYQPKIELSTDKIIGAEALVRWNSSDPELGFLSPAKFISLFEKNGFIEELDFIVYEKVFKFLRNQIDIGNNVVPISVNMSRNHTKEDKINNFISRFVSTFNKYNLSPDLVEVEILEQSVADDKIILQKVIDALHNNGFSIAMDDFGKGESSLNMLSSVPIDVVKFDQNFLRNNSSLEESSDFITSLVDLGKKLNKKTVFEGVETKEQRDFLRSINCDVVQGYFYSKPLSENDFIQFVKDHI